MHSTACSLASVEFNLVCNVMIHALGRAGRPVAAAPALLSVSTRVLLIVFFHELKCCMNIFLFCVYTLCLQSFDAVGWAAGMAENCRKLSGGVLAWLSVWSDVQISIWPS